MLLTRIWAVLLAVLATGCLAGMFLLSAGQSGDFTDADRDAVRAVTEAGVAALTAEISASKVQQVTALVINDNLRRALSRADEPGDDDDTALPLPQVLAEAAEELRLRTGANLTVAVVDASGKIVAANGISEADIPEVVGDEAFKAIPPTEDGQFSITLDDEIHVAKVTRTVVGNQRLVAVDKLNLGAGSLLRRVLGSDTPAGIVRKGKLVGEIIGDQPIADEIEALAESHTQEVPSEGASAVFSSGSGLDKRIGAIGRVPGPAGRGDDGSMLVVMSRETAAASQQDIAAAIGQARRKGARVNWPILVGLLLVSAALAIYLPHLEAIGPLTRLAQEFDALAVGQQHQVFHDRYGSVPGRTARAAAGAYEALRQAFLAELEIEDDGVMEEQPEPTSRRSTRRRRLTRAHQKLGERGDEQPSTTGSRPRTKTGALPPAEARPQPVPAAITSQPEPPPQPELPPQPAFVAPTPVAAPVQVPTPVPVPVPVPVPAPPLAAPPPPLAPPITAPQPAPMPAAPPPAYGEEEENEDDEFGEVFEEFVQVKQACGEPTDNLTYERFAAKLRKNERDLIAKRPDIKRVQFTVYVKDGKAALKAKVIK